MVFRPAFFAFFFLITQVLPVSAQTASENDRVQAETLFQGESFEAAAVTTDAVAYKDLAARLESEGKDFSAVFQALTARLLGRARWPVHVLEVRALFSGMIAWTKAGGRPLLHGRHDLALHFIHGGYLAATYGQRAADSAAYEKERKDSRDPGNFFDLDDMAATLMGARWLKGLGVGPGSLRRWLKAWSGGSRSLAHLPKSSFGRLAPKKLPSSRQVSEVHDFAKKAVLTDSLERRLEVRLQQRADPLYFPSR